MVFRLFVFAVVSIASIIVFSIVANRGFKKIDAKQALLYITSVAMIGVIGEIFVDSIYAHFFNTPLWRYNYLPVHGAYTSKYAPVLWGTFGLFLYLTRTHDRSTSKSRLKQAAFFGLEALVVEAIADLVSKVILGNYVFYYYPGGLWHISAFQNFPFYFLCGLVIAETIHWSQKSAYYFICLSLWVTIVTVYFT